MRKWKKFASGAGMLAILGIVGKAIGVFYRLPLTNILGAEGMGLYQMIFPLYSLILALCCGGLPAGLSKYVSELNASGQTETVRRALKLSIAVVFAIGLFAALIILLFGQKIASLQGNAKAGVAYVAIAPAIVLSGLIACFRGYFQGLLNLLPSGISQIIEQGVKVAFGLAFSAAFVHMGVEYGVLGALIGVSISEFAALFYLVVSYAVKRKYAHMTTLTQTETALDIALTNAHTNKQLKASSKSFEILKRIYSVALPVTLGSLVIPLSQVLDSFLVINLLVKSGEQTQTATALFGLFNGPVGSLLNMPSVITAAFAASLLPKVSYILGKGESPIEAADKSMSVFTTIILPCAFVFAITPYPVLKLLYFSGLTESELSIAASLLRLESINLVMVGLIQLASAMLQGAGKAGWPVINLVIGVMIKVIATFILLPVIGIYGAAVSNVACYGVTSALDLIFAKKVIGKFFLGAKQAKILLCAIAFALGLLSHIVLSMFMHEIIAFVCAAGLASAIYFALIVKTKCILLNEILS